LVVCLCDRRDILCRGMVASTGEPTAVKAEAQILWHAARWTFAAVLIAFHVASAWADELLDRVALAGESTNAGRQLASARKLAAAKQWADAVAEYQSLIENSGD